MGGPTPPVLQLLRVLSAALLLPQVAPSCDEVPDCSTITAWASTTQINVTGLAEEFFLQNITDKDGNQIRASDGSSNNTSLMRFVSGTQYVIHYGNDSVSCCYSATTKPMSVKSLQVSHVTPYSVSLTWSKPDEYQTSYSYRVQTNVSSSSNTTAQFRSTGPPFSKFPLIGSVQT
ncbi:receptor-type tyrosine-protein phosphatase eta-like [Dendropsophus ebraccatus]|uniref:receptor-type tyrosine-protein phosphatase eta-like n=1 Tax=Dendropsophus ebraccatus TaxID=150705 RepID=UPI003831F219